MGLRHLHLSIAIGDNALSTLDKSSAIGVLEVRLVVLQALCSLGTGHLLLNLTHLLLEVTALGSSVKLCVLGVVSHADNANLVLFRVVHLLNLATGLVAS